ncbi:MAG: symmetrical bis(5'-nucleosyl)-tetraphosphatase [Rubrivivax sp.]
MIHLVGDLQGCDAPLQQLVDQIGFSPSRDRLIFLGDLVNRGPDSLAVLRRVVAWGDAAGCLLGNHDLHLLAVAHRARAIGKGDTFDDVLAADDRQAWIDWLQHQPLARRECGWLCVHAGLVPQWTSELALSLAAEVEQLLDGPGAADFLHAMYRKGPQRWADDLQGTDRHRFIVDTLTRLRFCSADGTLDLETKDGFGSAPEGFMPWFDVPGRSSAGEPIAFGHWSTMGLVDRPDLLGLDTGCVWGGALTAVRVDGGRREIVQIDCPQARKPGA